MERVESHVREHPGMTVYGLMKVFGPSAEPVLYRLYKAGVVRSLYDPHGTPDGRGCYRYMHVMTPRSAVRDGSGYKAVYERGRSRWPGSS